MMRRSMPIILLAAGTILFSCKKSSPEVQATKKITRATVRGNVAAREGDCEPTTATLIAGQTIDAGTISVINDNDFIYVTYTTANGYILTETHLYVGDQALIPTNKPGNPIPGQFPFGNMHSNLTTYTYAVPISAIPLGTCAVVAAHAVVKKIDANGQVVESQTGWGNGFQINLSSGNWGMAFPYCSCSGL
jgi:hypothetical protein